MEPTIVKPQIMLLGTEIVSNQQMHAANTKHAGEAFEDKDSFGTCRVPPLLWLNICSCPLGLASSVLALAINLLALCLSASAELPDRFHLEVEVLEWFGAEQEPVFSDIRSGIGVRRLSRDGDIWFYEMNSQFIDKNAKASRSHVLNIFRGNGEKAVYMSFNRPENSARLDSDLLFVTLEDRAVSQDFDSVAEFPNGGDGCLLPFYFLHQKPIFGGAESWLNRAFPSSADPIREVVARDIEVSVEFELEKANNQITLKRCTFVFGPEAFWGGQRTKDRLVGDKRIPIEECKVEYKVTTSDRSSLGANSPIEWMSTDTLLLTDKSKVTNSIKYQLKEYSIDPITQQAFLRSANIPLGHSVAVEGAPQLPFVWNGDWAVPESELLASTKFSSVGAIWRTIGLIAFIAIPVFVWSVSRKRGLDRVAEQSDAILTNNGQSNRQ